MKTILASLLACVLALCGLARAQQDETHASATVYAVQEGSDVKLAVLVEIDEGWHLYHGPTEADIGEKGAVFEAVHGTAPDIAGQDKANPLAMLMSGVMMLNHVGKTQGRPDFERAAARIRGAYDAAIRSRECTRDLGGSLGTRAFADVLINRLAQL